MPGILGYERRLASVGVRAASCLPSHSPAGCNGSSVVTEFTKGSLPPPGFWSVLIMMPKGLRVCVCVWVWSVLIMMLQGLCVCVCVRESAHCCCDGQRSLDLCYLIMNMMESIIQIRWTHRRIELSGMGGIPCTIVGGGTDVR